MISVRHAAPTEFATLVEILMTALDRGTMEPATAAASAPAKLDETLLDREGCDVFVAERDGRPVGGGVVYLEEEPLSLVFIDQVTNQSEIRLELIEHIKETTGRISVTVIVV